MIRPRVLERVWDNLRCPQLAFEKNSFLKLNTVAASAWPEAFWEDTCAEAQSRKDEGWRLGGSESVVLTGVTSPIWVKKSMEKWSFLSYFYFVFVRISFGKIKYLDFFMEIVVMVTREKNPTFFFTEFESIRSGKAWWYRKPHHRMAAPAALI